MKNKTLVGILIAILFIFNFYLLVINSINKSKITGLSDIKQEITNYILEYQGTTEHLLQNSGFPLDSILIVDLDNSVTDFNNLLKSYGDKIVVCRTSQYNCETCNDYAIQKLSILCTENPNIQVVILGYYDCHYTEVTCHPRLGGACRRQAGVTEYNGNHNCCR